MLSSRDALLKCYEAEQAALNAVGCYCNTATDEHLTEYVKRWFHEDTGDIVVRCPYCGKTATINMDQVVRVFISEHWQDDLKATKDKGTNH